MSTENSENILICECHSREHQIVIEHDKEDNMVWCHIHLTKHGFWDRLKHGIKYIFGYQCRFGAFDEFIFGDNHIEKLEEVVDLLKKNKKK